MIRKTYFFEEPTSDIINSRSPPSSQRPFSKDGQSTATLKVLAKNPKSTILFRME